MLYPDSEEATQSEALVKTSVQNFQDLLGLFTGFRDRLEASVFESMYQTLREQSKRVEPFFMEVRTFGDLRWRSLAVKAVRSNFDGNEIQPSLSPVDSKELKSPRKKI